MSNLSKETGKTGVVIFYDEFYQRLFQRAHVFQEIFPNMRTRGQVLIYSTEFMLSMKCNDCPVEMKKINELGTNHKTKHGIRPWQFSVYIQTFLETVIFCLGTEATPSIGEAWTNVCAYTVGKMLFAFLPKMVNNYEFYQNCDGSGMSDRRGELQLEMNLPTLSNSSPPTCRHRSFSKSGTSLKEQKRPRSILVRVASATCDISGHTTGIQSRSKDGPAFS